MRKFAYDAPFEVSRVLQKVKRGGVARKVVSALAALALVAAAPAVADAATRAVPDTVSPVGTTINVFNYDAGSDLKSGINKDHFLKFNEGYDPAWDETSAHPSGQDKIMTEGGEPYINAWTGKGHGELSGMGGGPFEGIVQSTLGDDGYPVLADGKFYNRAEEVTSGGQSLAYLFDPSKEVDGRETYPNAQNLLYINQDKYFEYDSDTYYARYNEQDNAFTLTDQSQDPGFFPFNDQGATPDYHFGVSMTTRFMQTAGGIRPGTTNEALTYEFSGDDDVWIFIDGKLVADLGGIHDKASVSINFQSGAVTKTYAKDGDPAKEDVKHLSDFFDLGGNVTFPDNTLHTLKFFYLERGKGASNMKLKFNLVSVPESDITKKDAQGNPVQGAELKLYHADENYAYNESNLVTTVTTDKDGKVPLEQGDDAIYFEDLYNSKRWEYYVLVESGTPAGYRKSPDMHLRYDPNSGALLSQNRWETGAFAKGRLSTVLAAEGMPDEEALALNKELGGKESAAGFMQPDGTLDGMLFAVVQRFSGVAATMDDLNDGNRWYSAYPEDPNDPDNDAWHLSAQGGNGWDGVIEAAHSGGAFVATPNANGQYRIDMNLPGNIENYYHFILKNNEVDAKYDDVRWTVSFYFTTATNVADIKEGNTARLQNSNSFDRQFAASLQVTDMSNQLYIQKNDEEDNPVSGAEFSVYKKSDVTISDGKLTVNPGASAIGSVTTETGLTVGSKTLDGAAVYPGDPARYPDNKPLIEGQSYYLVETGAPKGYVKNESVVEVRVTESSVENGIVAGGEVLANATAVGANEGDDDGVDVVRGVGYLSPALEQFAYGVKVEGAASGTYADTTLHNIRAVMQTTQDVNLGNWDPVDPGEGDFFHLAYGSKDAVFDYGPQDEGGMLHGKASDGWSKLLIKQCVTHDKQPGQYEELGDIDLAPVFEGYTVVEFTNQTVNDLEISKTVTSDDAQYPLGGLKQKDFTFELKLKVPDANAVKPLNEYKVEILDAATGLVVGNEVPFDADGNNGKATFKLKDGQKAVVRGLPVQTEYDVYETYPGNGFTVSAGVNDNAAENTANVNGTLADADADSAAIDPVKVAYTNSYNVTPVADTLTATKTVASEVPGNKYTMKGGEFTFQLMMGNTVAQTATNAADGTVKFGEIKFTQPGTYTYTLSESGVDPNKAPGVSMDGSSYTITYKVVDKDAQLVIDSKKISKAGKDVGSITFENVYKTGSADLAIGGTKSITGIDGVTVERKPVSGEFEFVLTPESGALADGTTLTANEVPMPDGKLDGTAQAENTESTFSFDKITYASAGTYTYRVTEAKGDDPTIIYSDQDFEVVVTVTESGKVDNGEMQFNASMEVNGDDAARIAFVNTCKPTPATASIPDGTKTLDGRALAEGEFSFELKDASGNVVESVKNAKDGTFAFGDLTFDKPGIYTYTVTEANRGETIDGVTYDSTVYNIVIDVRENPDVTVHELVAKVTSVLDGKEVSSFDFTNTFKAAPAKAPIAATKVLTGRDLVEGEFAFQLKDKDGKVVATAHNDVEGKVEFGQIGFNDTGTYTFTLSEVEGGSKGVAYDNTVYQVTVEVVDDGESELKATVSYNADPVFKNVFTPDKTPGGGTQQPGANPPAQGGGDKLAATGDSALAPIALMVIALAGAALVVAGRFLAKRR